MTIDKKASERFYLIYFIAACVIVSIHCGDEMQTEGIVWQEYIRFGARWALPFFFLLSGAFFRLGYTNTFSGFVAAARKKFFSLILPYILWCLIGLAMRMPIISDEFCQMSLWGMFDETFGITTSFPIGNMVLWFIRSIIVFQFGLMFVLGCVSKDRKLRLICWGVVLLLCAFLSWKPFASVIIGAAITNPSGPFYFFMGYFLAKVLVARPRLMWDILMLVGGIVFCCVVVLSGLANPKLVRHLLNFGIIPALIGGCDLLLSRRTRPLGKWIYTTFFMYCFHRAPVEYMARIVNKMTFINVDVRFFLFFAISVLLMIACAHLLQRYLPRFYSLITGSRR